MKKNIITILLLGIIFNIPIESVAQSGSFSSSQINTLVNQEFEVIVNADNLTDVGTVDLYLSYTFGDFTFLRAEAGALMSPNFSVMSAVSQSGVTEKLSIAIVPESFSVSGSGELVKLFFMASSTPKNTQITLNEVSFSPANLLAPTSIYPNDIATITIEDDVLDLGISTIAESWRHGSSDSLSSDYWNLVAVNPKLTFEAGEEVCVLSKISNITSNHRWKTEFFLDGKLIWSDESPLLEVGSGWAYTNAFPILYNVSEGSYRVKVWFDQGAGYELKSNLVFDVIDSNPKNEFLGASVCESWSYGSTDPNEIEYWNFSCNNPKTIFNEGERVHVLAQVKNISIEHSWRIDVYYNDKFIWDYSPGYVNTSGNHWTYSNFTPYIDNVKPGNYELKIFFDDGLGYQHLSSLNFSVNSLFNNSMPYLADFDASTFGFVQEDNSSSIDGSMKLATIDGRNCLELESLGGIGEFWHIQSKKTGLEFNRSASYQGSIWLKGENTGTFYIAIQKDSDPWNNLGLWKAVSIDNSWKHYDLDFTFIDEPVDPSDIRFTIFHGSYEGKIWIDDLSFSQ